MSKQLETLDEVLVKEAEDPGKTWTLDPYSGKLKRESVTVSSQQEIELKLAQSLVGIREDDPDLARLPVLGLVGTLKKEMDKKYKLDTLKQLEAVDKLVAKTN